MTSFYIGSSGLDAAQKALDIIGNNLANAATEGYHCQRVELSPAYASTSGGTFIGGGVNFTGVTRLIDNLLEHELLTQQSILERVEQEYDTLRVVESSFGEFSSGSGLNAKIDDFFNSLQDICSYPDQLIQQSQLVNSAGVLAGRFNTLSQFLSNLQSELTFEAENAVERINSLAATIADLNGKIERIEVSGQSANNLKDQRDECISKLSEIISVETVSREYGIVDVNVAGIPIVSGTNTIEVELGLEEDGKTGVGITGTYVYQTDIQGGQLGGLLSLKNELISEVADKLDELAGALIYQVNRIHTQGVGSYGSFTELSGWVMKSENLSEFDPPIDNGQIFVRITDTNTGEIYREAIDVDATADTLTSIAAKLSGITGLSATVSSSRILIQAEPGYKFDFLPAVLPEPTASNLTATSPPEVSVTGVYTGEDNQTYTCEVVSGGFVGNDVVQIEVRNGAGDLVKTLNVGAGYAADDYLELADGVKISLGQGELNAGDSFEIDCFSNTDTSGFLAAAGLNCFFAGSGASDISVCKQITEQPSMVAVSVGPEMTDNVNATKMLALRDEPLSSLDEMTIGDFYRGLITDIGLNVSAKQTESGGVEAVITDLQNRQSEISGVDINDEAAQLLLFEKMFQAMAKYINTVQATLLSIMEII